MNDQEPLEQELDEELAAEDRLTTVVRAPEEGDSVVVVEAQGEVDLSTTHLLRSALDEAVAASSEVDVHLIVEMSGVTYMDSSGFGTLLGISKMLRPLDGSVHLVGVNPGILRMLEITRLNTVFGIHATEAEARAAAPGRAAAMTPAAA